MLGLHVIWGFIRANNLEKSELIPIEDVSNLEDLVGVLGCKVSVLPTTYLGLLLGALYKSAKVWEEV